MPAKKISKAKPKVRGKGRAMVTYFAHEHLDLLKRAQAKAKADKSSFAAVMLAALAKAV